jgi:hypothetical protein
MVQPKIFIVIMLVWFFGWGFLLLNSRASAIVSFL